jgi:hypothetical protein
MEKSESIKTIAAALLKFSGKMTKVVKDSVNPHFRNKYASLSTIIESTQPVLVECGLTVVQLPSGENELTTVLLHESGEYISSTYKMTPSKNDPQGLGSAITYQRRYAYGAILNLNIDEDDDGNKGSQPPQKPETPEIKEWMNDSLFNSYKENIEACKSQQDFDAIAAEIKEWKTAPRGISNAKHTELLKLFKEKQELTLNK